MKLIAICVLLGVGGALVLSLLQEERYSARASLLFRDPGFDQSIFGAPSFAATPDPAREAATNLKLVSLDVVANKTAKSLEGDVSGSDVTNQVSIEQVGASDVVDIIATNTDPQFAAKLANEFARNYVKFRREADQAKIEQARRLVEAQLESLSPGEKVGEEGKSLQDQLSSLKTLEALQTGNAEVVQKASVPTAPSSPKITVNTALGLVLGVFVGVGLALLRERLDRRLNDTEELEEYFGLPVLTSVPESEVLDSNGTAEAADSNGHLGPLPFVEREAFSMLRARLRYFNVDREIKSVLVTSAAPGEGKSTVAWNLAVAAAGAGSSAILVEADFHAPAVGLRQGAAPLPGLAEFLTHQTSLEGAIQTIPMGGSPDHDDDTPRKFSLIVSGASPPNALELLESHEMAKLVQSLEQEYDLVVIDTPPASFLADAIPMMRLVTGVILVGAVGKTTRDDAVRLREQLDSLDVPLLGVVANGTRRSRKYGYGYGYGYGNEQSPKSPKSRLFPVGRR